MPRIDEQHDTPVEAGTPEDQPKQPAPVASERGVSVQVALQDEKLTVPAVNVDGEKYDHVYYDPADFGSEVAVSVPGLFHSVEPVELVETENGFERPADDQPEARLPLDDSGRLVLTKSPVTVPVEVANALAGLPYVKVVD